MFVGNKYVNTNKIFFDDKVTSAPYQSLIYISNEEVIKKKGIKVFFFGSRGGQESQICSPGCTALHALGLWCLLHVASSQGEQRETVPNGLHVLTAYVKQFLIISEN